VSSLIGRHQVFGICIVRLEMYQTVRLYETFVVPVLQYGSECWCLRKEDERKILTAEMTWLRKILHVTRRGRIKNIDVRETLQQKETMIDKIRRRRFTWFGHVSRMDEKGCHLGAFMKIFNTRSKEVATSCMESLISAAFSVHKL